jgi:hypothetical protein
MDRQHEWMYSMDGCTGSTVSAGKAIRVEGMCEHRVRLSTLREPYRSFQGTV